MKESLQTVRLILVLFSVVIAGCASPQTTSDFPISPSPIEVLTAAPVEKYMIVGEVSGTGSVAASDQAICQALQKEAEKLNAHAIILKREGIQVYQKGSENIKHANALAIRYTDGIPAARDVGMPFVEEPAPLPPNPYSPNPQPELMKQP